MIAAELQERLDAASAASGAVGAVVSAGVDGERFDAAAGVLDVRGTDLVRVDTPFRLGSIAKALTATVLVDLLAEAGRSLDEAVDDLLPGCLPAAASGRITWRHLLLHRLGIDGTFWEGCGDGPDAAGTYASRVSEVELVFEPGASWGYSNSGFVLAGAAIEVLTGTTYETAVAERVLDPLDASSTVMWAPAPPDRAATGHHLTADGPRPADVPTGLRALAPAGATAFTTAPDVLALADRLLADRWPRLLAEATPMPPGGGTAATHQALGWRAYRWGDAVLFGHDGGATGTGSFVRWVPERRSGLVVLGNTNPSAMLLWADLSAWFFDRMGISVPPWLPKTAGAAAEPEWCGTDRCRDATFTITIDHDGALRLALEGIGGGPARTATLTPLTAGIYRSDVLLTDPTRIVSFEQSPSRAQLLHAGPLTARADD